MLTDYDKAGLTDYEKAGYAALKRLRIAGWLVAVHNDYRVRNTAHTFWLFTRGDFAIKGEGYSDTQALEQAEREAKRVLISKSPATA